MTGWPLAQALPGKPSSWANNVFSLTALNSAYSALQRLPPNSSRVRVRSGTHSSTTRMNVLIRRPMASLFEHDPDRKTGDHFSGIMLPACHHPPFGGLMGVQISGRGCSNFE